MAFNRKVLWVVSMDNDQDEQLFAEHVDAAGIDTVCIRTTSPRLPAAIDRFHTAGKKVWAWRWPGIDPDQPTAKGPHYFAQLEADFVADHLIPAALDGYIVDPESDHAGDVNDWNDRRHAQLAMDFWARIKAKASPRFMFGTTSGCAYPSPAGKPNIPWAEFFGPSAALYPQCYWRMSVWDKVQKKDVPVDINGGTPTRAIARGMSAWNQASMGKPVVPMAGEIDLATVAEIQEYGAQLRQLNLNEAHFYADLPAVKPEVLAAIKAL
jgi:hypothetical protein